MRLSDLKTEKRSIEIDWHGDKVAVTYDFLALTPLLQAEMAEAVKLNDVSGLVKLLAALLISWDVLDDANERIPPTLDNLMPLPLAFLNVVAQAIGEDIRGNPQNAESSFSD
jgi:hypothetical protein